MRNLSIYLLCALAALTACKAPDKESHAVAEAVKEAKPDAKTAADSVDPDQVPAALVELLRTKMDLGDLIGLDPDGSSSNLIARKLDLNTDGNPEIVVEGRNILCGAANCPTWIFASTRGGYSLLLDAGSTQDLQALPNATNGYSDVTTRVHESATESIETIYKFDGAVYKPFKCTQVNYTYLDDNGELHELREPRVTTVTCDQP